MSSTNPTDNTDSPQDSSPADRSAIDLSVVVDGTPEAVWAAIATGPGISSWYVPSTVEEFEDGATTSRFGAGPEMTVPGRVAKWEPPSRVLFDGGPDAADGLAFEWLVEARSDGTCIVRMVNSGFGNGGPWDDQYDAMRDGWGLFLHNLQLHCRHFLGQEATAMLPMAMWPGSQAHEWARLLADLGLPSAPRPGDVVRSETADAPAFSGTVVQSSPWRLSLLLDFPAPGTAFLAAEGADGCGVSVWQYLYGPDAAAIVERDEPRWNVWLAARAAV
jgi:uncharacterized protein YndB with AHSA1/START domain